MNALMALVSLLCWLVAAFSILTLLHDLNRAERQLKATKSANEELLQSCLLVTHNAPLIAEWIEENDPGAFRQILNAIDNSKQEASP